LDCAQFLCMQDFPDFSQYGYEILSELGRNREGGRITWLAQDLSASQKVVIKQFCFAQSGSDWSGYNAHQREIEILQGLTHPGIPKYLNSIETPEGFLLIQEYKAARTLLMMRSYTPEEIKKIAIDILEILVYLQNRVPEVLHRDIKPENLLLGEQGQVYLIDFGFSKIGSEAVAGSSVFKGTLGYIAPEQLFKPTKASDLYSLGATIIFLLTRKQAGIDQELIVEDEPYQIGFQHLLPDLSLKFIDWLTKMVAPSQKERFDSASTALTALHPIYLFRTPELQIYDEHLELQAQKIGQRLSIPIEFGNDIPETILEGWWEVAPHHSDLAHNGEPHPWISVSPPTFCTNQGQATVLVNTLELMADCTYQREIILHSNSSQDVYTIPIKIHTAPLPLGRRRLPHGRLFIIWILAAITPLLIITVTFSIFVLVMLLMAFAMAYMWVAHTDR
jgi:serine/threonine protein kinase